MRFTKLLFLQTGPWRETHDELSSLYFLDGSRSFFVSLLWTLQQGFFFSNIFANFSGNKEGNTILVKQILSLRAQFDVSRFFIYLLSYFSIKLRRTTELWRRYALFPQKCHSSVTIRYVTHWRMNKKKKNTVRKQTSNIIIFTAITVIYARCFAACSPSESLV